MDAARDPRVVADERHLPGGRTRRRRPSGEPPPLPRDLGRSGRFWLIMAGYFLLVFAGALLLPTVADVFQRLESAVLRWIAELRTPWLTDAMKLVNVLALSWTIRILRWGTIGALIAFRRWRHLFVFLGALIVTGVLAYDLSVVMGRPRPLDVRILASWEDFSMPSRPMAGLAVTLIGMAYCLVVPGRPRYRTKWAIGIVLGLVGLARIYLAVEFPTDAVFGAIFGVAIGLVAFRLFTPNDVFPVTYGRGKAAHLDVGGRRGEAIVAGVRDQLDMEVLDLKPVGLEASGGSTPLRLRIAAGGGQPERYLFAKLYAKSHVRADRWYKLGRTILYGALEDESRFTSVRRFVEYEDYTLRLLQDLGLPSPTPYGVVEITPEREYMIVMEFFDGAVEISEADVDDSIIEQGLMLVRRLWDEGLAHRDIKPANLMVQDGQLKLIDVFFVQVRPSPWRQAVDLANMMLVLALRTDADRVYQRATSFFTEDELAEAFAATRGVASPTQLRAHLKRDGRDLLARFRRLAPDRAPVAIQRWSIRRVTLTLGVVLVLMLALLLVVNNWAVFA
ncbi:MAG TPA: phosphatase PAP2 family protein [Actinomycetota bacterium]|jgi:tRNA A-37 threonylcarbamoyl transferase component Bud32/membrane-associated phospholipid phosphatase|nr:phosphatase PAP2 family protein [Actinomycetota bacterium]